MALETLRDGRILIEAGSKKEIEALGEKIQERCGEELEINIQKLLNTRLVMLNIPSDITLENVKETLTQQNTELNLKDGNIDPKFSYTTKRGIKNLVIEVDSNTRKILLQNRIKMGWIICKVDDCMVAKRCFRCNRFNHTHKECIEVEICPLCSGNHVCMYIRMCMYIYLNCCCLVREL